MRRFYKIYVLNSNHCVSLAYDFMGPDDAGAIREGTKHAAQNDVEVWQGDRIVARIPRGRHAAVG